MTSKTTLRCKRGQLMISLALVALSLGACSKPADQLTQPATAPPLAALPLATAEPPAYNAAPAASQLPWPARPIRVAQPPRYDRYGYVDDAYDMGYGFADAPPDYAFDYDGSERPWAWRANDGAYRIVEWLPDGERVYYYQPNDYYPFFVSDPDYSYAFDDGELVGLYDPYGYPLDDGTFGDRAYNATRYFNRGRDLYRAAIYQPRRSAYAENWLGRRDYLRGQQQRWDQGQARDPDWRSWRSRHQGNESRWRPEHDRRMSYAMASAAGWGAVRNRMEQRVRDRGGQQQSAGFGGRSFEGRGHPQLAQGWQHNAGNGVFQHQQAMTDQGRRGGWQHGQPMMMAPLHQTRDGRFAGNGLFAQRQADRRGDSRGFRMNQQRWQQADRPGGQQRFANNRFFRQHQMVEQRQRAGGQQAMQQRFVQRQQQERQRGGWQRAMEQRFVQRQQQQQQRSGWQQAMQQRFVQRQQQERQGGGWQQAAQARMVQQQQQQRAGWQHHGGGEQHGGWQQSMQARAQAQPQHQAPSNNFARFAQAGGGPQHGNGGGGGGGNAWGGHHGHH